MADVIAEEPVEVRIERHRTELTGYCYRMLGSVFEAEDAVQETMVRAWRGYQGFEGRAALRSWLYRIATNVCLDALNGRNNRARPMDLAGPVTVATASDTQLPEVTWIGPAPDGRVLPETGDPAEVAAQRESVKLAFVAALQRLAPRQRAVLILREVLGWKAAEAAELLGVTVASVNSALQRARAVLAADDSAARPPQPLDADHRALLDRYVTAFEAYDMDGLAALLHEDVTLNMPPFSMWLRGRGEIRDWMLGPGHGCRGSRLVPVTANGGPAFGQYRPSPAGGHEPWALIVPEVSGGRITGLTNFLDTDVLFPLFGLPPRLDAE
ncbi:sigma-70 family RNA polymerase sigma factor [Streptomyces rubellomurinus]|uniref:RNA polymerase sigma70 factor n=2 Tax=Streptomyces TaxID=1883 RepID=A0A0F2TG69_STRR3|nr:sigma-70 family RNA polymerase sigma factor [Streptomyces rubellomurinus]KJS56953.1 RNA polymerase sigma70 factor [Streptomyces rubellomurinus subsp. indigoferus]KJS61245.1 RNA polymerase sigma70 factor [Streptomyces rubellomurinus]